MAKAQRKKERKFGKGAPQHQCIFCKNNKGLIHMFGKTICRKCFRKVAEQLGFKKYGR